MSTILIEHFINLNINSTQEVSFSTNYYVNTHEILLNKPLLFIIIYYYLLTILIWI